MRDKIIRFEINAQNKQLIELQLESKDCQYIDWERTKVEIIIDLGYIAFNNIEYLNAALFYWLKLGAVDVHIIINNVSEDNDSSSSHISNINFFNSIVNKLESCSLIRYLKITVMQANIFNAADFTGLVRMQNLQILDLSTLCLQQDEINDYLIPLVNLLNSIHEASHITKILLPSNLKQHSLNVEYNYENQLFSAIKYALSTSIHLIEISPLPLFLELQDDIVAFMNQKQGGHLEELYYEHDRDYETIKQLKSIPSPTSEVTSLLASKMHKFNNQFKDIDNLCQIIISMKPKNIYWLDKILREKLADPTHILSCVRTVKVYDGCQELLFKMLQGLVSDVISGRFKELDVNAKELTNFVCVDGLISKDIILKTLFKIHLEFDFSNDEYLAKIFSNIIEDFVYGCGGCKLPYDVTRLAPSNKLDDPGLLLMNCLKAIENLYLTNKRNEIEHNETNQRNNIYIKQLEERTNLLLFAFNYFNVANQEPQDIRNGRFCQMHSQDNAPHWQFKS